MSDFGRARRSGGVEHLVILHPGVCGRRCRPVAWVHRWTLWSIPRPARAFLLSAELTAAALTVGLLTREPPTARLLLRAGILLALTIGYAELAKRSERIKRYLGAGNQSPRPNPMSVWSFAALLVLPAGWAAGFIVVQYGHALFQRRRDRSGNPYRVTFTAAAAIVAQLAAASVLDETAAGGVLHGEVAASLSVLAAAVLFTLVDIGVLLAGMRLTVRPPSIRAMLPDGDALGYELASLALGIGAAEMLLHTPAIVAALVIPVAYLHRSSMVKTLHQASRTDSKTGLLNAAAWTEHATGVASRCARAGQPRRTRPNTGRAGGQPTPPRTRRAHHRRRADQRLDRRRPRHAL